MDYMCEHFILLLTSAFTLRQKNPRGLQKWLSQEVTILPMKRDWVSFLALSSRGTYRCQKTSFWSWCSSSVGSRDLTWVYQVFPESSFTGWATLLAWLPSKKKKEYFTLEVFIDPTTNKKCSNFPDSLPIHQIFHRHWWHCLLKF